MSDRYAILIVEDEQIVALGLAFAAEDAGAVVIGPAASTIEALALLAENRVDAAILDVQLCDRDVTPVALALIDRAVPFVFQTATELPQELAMAHPDLDVIHKPVSPTEVVARLLGNLELDLPTGAL